MHVIDSIKPRRTAARNDHRPLARPRQQPAGVIDGVRRRSKTRVRPVAQPASPRAPGARFAKLGASRGRRRLPSWPAVLSIVLSPLLFGLAYIGSIGVMALVVYGVIVVALRWSSRYTFMLALAALLFITGLQLIGAEDIAQSMAVLAYELLAIGVIALGFEARRDNKVWFQKKTKNHK